MIELYETEGFGGMTTEDELAGMADEVRALCAIMTKVARRDLEKLLDRRDAGIRAIEHGVLRNLQGGGLTLASLSRAMMMTPSSLVPVVDRLEDKSLLRRGKDPKDRRRSPLSLTGEAVELMARIPAMDGDSVLVEALDSMSDERRDQLLASLRLLVGRLTDEEGSHGEGFEVEGARRDHR